MQNKANYLDKKAVDRHFAETEEELLVKLLKDKENIVRRREENPQLEEPRFTIEVTEPMPCVRRRSILMHTERAPEEFSSHKVMTTAQPISSFKKSERNVVVRENLGSLIFETPPKEKLTVIGVNYPFELLSANIFNTSSPFCTMYLEEPSNPVFPLQSPSHFMLTGPQ